MLLLTGLLHLVIVLGQGCKKLGRKHPNHEEDEQTIREANAEQPVQCMQNVMSKIMKDHVLDQGEGDNRFWNKTCSCKRTPCGQNPSG